MLDVHATRHALRTLTAVVFLALSVAACGGGSGNDDADATATSTAIAATPTPAASPGDLDAAFGQGGVAVVPFGAIVGVPARGLRVESDGTTRVLVSTFRGDDPTGRRTLHEVVLTPEGTLAPGGVATLTPTVVDVHTAAYTQTGDVVVASREGAATGLQRLRPGRDPDSSFGDAGIVPLRIPEVHDVVPLGDGGVLVVGRFQDRSALERFDAAGTRDPGFGEDGLIEGPARSNDVSTVFRNAAAGPDGRIAVGAIVFASLATRPIVSVYDDRGVLDPSFGGDGVVELPGLEQGTPVFLPTGTMLVGLSSGIARLGPDGTIDEGYRARTESALEGGAGGLTASDDGTVTTAGGRFVPDEPRRFGCETSSGGVCQRRAFVVHRLLPAGGPDPRFGGNGTVITDLGPYGAQDTGYGPLLLAPPGSITVVGSGCPAPLACDLVVGRYRDTEPVSTP